MRIFASTRRAKPATALLYLVHFWSVAQLEKFLRLRRALPRGWDLYLLFDSADPQAEAAWRRDLAAAGLEDAIATFDKAAVLQRLGHPPFYKGITLGSMHFPLIAFAQDHPRYRHIWLIEYDVRVASWRRFLRSFRRSEADLLLSHFGSYARTPRWRHWDSLTAPAGTRIAWNGGDGVAPLRGFMPIYRISAAALAGIDAAHAAGWQGQFEAVVPTALGAAGFAIEDFNEHGDFYTPGRVGPREGRRPLSSLRWQPQIAPEEIERRKRVRIYHPVKG